MYLAPGKVNQPDDEPSDQLALELDEEEDPPRLQHESGDDLDFKERRRCPLEDIDLGAEEDVVDDLRSISSELLVHSLAGAQTREPKYLGRLTRDLEVHSFAGAQTILGPRYLGRHIRGVEVEFIHRP